MFTVGIGIIIAMCIAVGIVGGIYFRFRLVRALQTKYPAIWTQLCTTGGWLLNPGVPTHQQIWKRVLSPTSAESFDTDTVRLARGMRISARALMTGMCAGILLNMAFRYHVL